MAENGQARSSLRDFIASISTIKGDLSNITAPPFVLADKSTTEFPQYWIEQPDLFCAPARETDATKRLVAVLKWFLASLKGQQYAGREPAAGIKKPLNAFLGEVFLGECRDRGDGSTTQLVAEQVSHHPPVTACYLWNEAHGVRAEGYTRQEVTFSGTVNIRQVGHAVLHLDAFDEDYLIPLPDVQVKAVLTGSPYPELQGSHAIVASTGLVAHVDFSGTRVFGIVGERNRVHAAVYAGADDAAQHARPLFTADGIWSERFDIKDATGQVVDSYDVAAATATALQTRPLEHQDPWESRRAWGDVIAAIRRGDMQAVADHKKALEEAQREMRRNPDTSEQSWRPLFFVAEQSSPAAEKLLAVVGQRLDPDATHGVWRFHGNPADSVERPFRGKLTPFG